MQIGVSNGGNAANFCIERTGSNGLDLPLGDFGSDLCGNFNVSFAPDLGIEYEASVSLDRASKQIVFRIDDQTRAINIPTEIFPVNNPDARIQFYQAGQPGTGVAVFHGIATDNFDDDFAVVTPLLGRYAWLDGNVELVDGRVRIENTSTAELEQRSLIAAHNGIDHIEALFVISEESQLTVNRDSRANGELFGVFYNDLSDNRSGDRTGDISAGVGLNFDGDGRREVFYCLERSEDAESNQRTGLLPDGDRCAVFDILPEYNIPYRLSVSLDRGSKTITIKINAREYVHNITTDIFNAASEFHEIASRARGDTTSVVYIDNVRTAPGALTSEEQVSGPLPEVPEGSDVGMEGESLVENPLAPPVPVPAVPLVFTDDFSNGTDGFITYEESDNDGTTQVGIVDGAVEIRAASGAEDDTQGQLDAWGKSDYLAARVSLSSTSTVPVNGEARIALQGSWYNDTQDGGFNGREGDVFVQLRIRLLGSGRRELSFCLDRDRDGGGGDPVNIVDGNNCGNFDGYVPELDTGYDLSIRLDRERGVLIFKADERVREVVLNTQAFLPNRSRKAVKVQHSGDSGFAVGKIYSIATDNYSQDFAIDPPVIGPYRPYYDTQDINSNISFVDERVRLEATSVPGGNRTTKLELDGASDYIGALVNMSSESTIDHSGRVWVRVGGIFFNDLKDGGNNTVDNDNEGDVFAATLLIFNQDGSSHAEYCAVRSNTSNFEDNTLLTPDPADATGKECARFDVNPSFDTDHTISTSIDREAGKLIFTVDGEIREYDIPVTVYAPSGHFKRVGVRAYEASNAIAFADDVRSAENAPLLAMSENAVGSSALPPLPGESDTTKPPTKESGGGCSVAPDTVNPFLPLLALLSLLMLLIKRRRLDW